MKFIKTLSEDQWREQQRLHKQNVSELLGDYFKERAFQNKHPVVDFLFEYYSLRKIHLETWMPGLNTALTGNTEEFKKFPEFSFRDGYAFLDPQKFPTQRLEGIEWTKTLLVNTAKKVPFLKCYGLHEWAMVYKSSKIRHNYIPLRMPAEEIQHFVESQTVCCSHYDAFRFFTKEARPLNIIQPTREKMPSLEQPGCLHTNMDLYRWSYKFYPWISSRILGQAFQLAYKIREIDMRASPYDLAAYGYSPIPIETEAGREEYVQWQEQFSRQGEEIRKMLISEYEYLLETCQTKTVE